MSVESKNRCARCGKRIKKGGDSWRFKGELISHFDGYIRVNPDESIAQTIDKINSKLGNLTHEEIDGQVYRKFEYLVCPVCRDDLEKFLQTE